MLVFELLTVDAVACVSCVTYMSMFVFESIVYVGTVHEWVHFGLCMYE